MKSGSNSKFTPAGYINTAQFIKNAGEKSAWTFEVGHNAANRQDFGVHDNEEGGGFGFGVGYRRYLNEGLKGFYAEANLETWLLDIDWLDRNPIENGKTEITVLQPTFGVGYQFRSKSENWAATAGATFGREWNVKTEGEEVGQGGISLLVFSISRRL